METSKKAFSGEASIDVKALVDRMKSMAPGDVVPYRELTQLIGRDVTVFRYLTDSARRILMRDHNMVYRSVINTGFKRLDDAETINVVSDDRRNKIRRQSAVAVRELTTVDYAKVDQAHQTRHNMGMALFGSLFQATSQESVKKLTERVANAGGRIDATGTLKLVGWLAD
jgi:hypothetical protein